MYSYREKEGVAEQINIFIFSPRCDPHSYVRWPYPSRTLYLVSHPALNLCFFFFF